MNNLSKNLSKRVFRHLSPVTLTRADGTVIKGRGLVARFRPGEAWGREPHAMGELSRPLFVFTGDLAGAQPGEVLSQGGKGYTVLEARPVAAGGCPLWLRAVLEEREEPEEPEGSEEGGG